MTGMTEYEKRTIDDFNSGRENILEWVVEVLNGAEKAELELLSYHCEPGQNGGLTDPSWSAYLESVEYEKRLEVFVSFEKIAVAFDSDNRSYMDEVLRLLCDIDSEQICVELDYEHAGSYEVEAILESVVERGDGLVFCLNNIELVDDSELMRNVETYLKEI
jgi:hypothetical protein